MFFYSMQYNLEDILVFEVHIKLAHKYSHYRSSISRLGICKILILMIFLLS